MAKKKSTNSASAPPSSALPSSASPSSAPPSSAPPSSAPPSSARPAAVKAATSKPATVKRTAGHITDEQIGIVAGKIWHLLSADGSQSLTSLKKAVDAQPDLVAAAVGWLAREGKLEFAKSGRSVKLTLR